MRTHTRFKPKTLDCSILVALAMTTATGAWAGPSVSMSPDAVTVTPASDEIGVTVRVNGPGGLHFEEDGSEAVVIDTYDAYGDPLPDGQYSYEGVGTPALSADAKAAMALARATGDDTEVARMKLSGAIPTDTTTSGYFRIENGAILMPEGPEPPATLALSSTDGRPDGSTPGTGTGSTGGGGTVDVGTDDRDDKTRDQFIADDLIVQGSACVGTDCVNNENFGFDTLRLKENNLRIKFDDTSSSASFPKNDWQLTANESDNGGAEKFSIDDVTGGRTPFTIEAGAPTNSLYVDGGGDVGLGTKTPVVELHIVDGDSPTLRLEQNGSSGFQPQTWDVAGNETNFFVRDATNGSKLPFRIRPTAPDNSIYIDTDGDVGMGTNSPDAQLHVVAGDQTPAVHVAATAGTGANDSILLENNGPARMVLRNSTKTSTATEDADWILNSNGTFRISAGADTAEFVLDASGNLTLSGNCADAGGGGGCTADHVFESGYDLMPLEGLAAFIAKNKRLPDVPSAEDTRREGLNLTKMNGRLLEKIEELTLYTLQQQERIDRLEAEILAVHQQAGPAAD